MGRKVARPDVHMAEIAAEQHGVISLGQLRRLGFGEKAIRRRLDAGRLHRVHRGVYAVGHPGLSSKGDWLAAVIAIGGGPYERRGAVLGRWGAALSHRSAASLWQLLHVETGPSDVVVAGDGGRSRRKGIRVRRSLSLLPADVTLRIGIPVTTPRRTIDDLRQGISMRSSGSISAWELRKAIRQANVIGLPLDEEDAADRTRSDLEADFLAICKRGRLRRPEVNVRIGPYLVDFLWRQDRFVVETDSYLYHRGEVAFQDDHVRDFELRRLGYDVLRLSERQIDEAPNEIAEQIALSLEL